MKSWHKRLLLSAVFLSLWPLHASGNWFSSRANGFLKVHHAADVRDESDPKDTRSCYEMGQLEISYQSQDRLPPAVGVLVTDPRGRRIGYDPVGPNAWQELPLAQAFIDCTDQDANGQPRACTGWIQICGPLSGTYRLEVSASESGKYSVNISAVSQQKRSENGFHATESRVQVADAPIRKGSQDTLLLEYSREPGSKIALIRGESTPLAQRR